ncbi:hypothetical protein T492DRAFT_850447 [Pavlovales sp. CCMP2436]|nr:hypothetical protein T492DRAFT_850447 [Pavlovales sp. CCMP2436]
MPYLTHADAEAAKAAEAEAAARSKIAVTAPARKPVFAATAPARNGEAEWIDMCAEEEREEEEEERNAETILCTSARFKFLLLARLCRLSWPKGKGGWHCSCGGGGSGTTCTNCRQRKPDPENPSFVLAEVPVPLGKAPKKGANKVGKEKSDKAPGPEQLKM